MFTNKGNFDERFPRMNLQLFAEGEQTSETVQTDAQSADTQTDNQQTEQTFTQADVDRIVNQRLARAQRDEAKRIEQARAEARSEAEKLAQMSESQRAEQAAREREAYETSPIVQTCRMLLGQSFGKMVKISLQDFLDASVRGCGMLAAATVQELSSKLTAFAPQLLQYDGILISQGKRVGQRRGIYISTTTEKGEKHGQ